MCADGSYGSGVRWTVTLNGCLWQVEWLPGDVPPPGTNHGSSGVCFTSNGVVLVSRDGERWEFPAGRPELQESLLDTLSREIGEEACCRVESAEALGFTMSKCLDGPEEGLVLVRAHWSVQTVVEPWRPRHEITHRIEVPLDAVMNTITIAPGLEALYSAIWGTARQTRGYDA